MEIVFINMLDQVKGVASAVEVTTLAVRPAEGEVGAGGYGKVVSGWGGKLGGGFVVGGFNKGLLGIGEVKGGVNSVGMDVDNTGIKRGADAQSTPARMGVLRGGKFAARDLPAVEGFPVLGQDGGKGEWGWSW